MPDSKNQNFEIPMTGKWKPAFPGAQLASGDFRVLTNMRYVEKGIQSVKGMSKITTVAITDEEVGAPEIGYTTQQMTTGATQQLTVTGGQGPYTWSIPAGGGTIEDGLYTAPATNPNCIYNPTIRVCDALGQCTELQIAANGYAIPTTAYSAKVLIPFGANCGDTCGSIWGQGYDCDGNNRGAGASCRCGTCCCAYTTTCWDCVSVGNPCDNWGIELCQTPNCTGVDGKAHCGGDCDEGTTVDWRSVEELENGCCPAILL